MCSIKNLPRKINKPKHVLTVINLYFYSKISCSGVLSFHSAFTDKYSFHYFFLVLITAGFCVPMLAGSVLFHAASFFPSLIFRQLCAYNVYMMFLLFSQFSCVLFFRSLQTYLFVDFSLPSDHVKYSLLYIWSKTAGILWDTWVYFFIYFLFFKSLSWRTGILPLNFVSLLLERGI